MTDLRSAAQQALEALEDMLGWQSLAPQMIQESAKGRAYALRAALVEDAMQKFTDVNQELEAALVEPVQEPVAGRAFLERILTAMEGVIDVADRKTDEFDALRSCVIDLTSMLHTAPPQRKPLTEEALDELAMDEDGLPNSHLEFARAVERAHGIEA